MILADAAKAGALLFFAALLQVTILAPLHLLGGTPDLLLVTLAAVALLRGSIVGAAVGFWAGLVVDTANLGTLGFSSLLYTLAGYWIGRYGETTGRDRSHAPLLSVGVITILYAFTALALHYMLGDPAPARLALVDSLPGTTLLNLVLTLPVYALCRRIFRPAERADGAAEVRLLG